MSKIVNKMDVQKVGFHEKGHISENMSPTDLRQVSKFSLGRYPKLFPWHPKDLVGRKIFLGESKISILYFYLYISRTFWSHGKWDNSVIICPSDLGQGSKFSLIRYLKLFLWHQKYLTSRKNNLEESKKIVHFFLTPFTCQLLLAHVNTLIIVALVVFSWISS